MSSRLSTLVSVRHIDADDYHETLIVAVSVQFFPALNKVIAHGCPSIVDDGSVQHSEREFMSGKIYVMNPSGQTVGFYNLQERRNGAKHDAA